MSLSRSLGPSDTLFIGTPWPGLQPIVAERVEGPIGARPHAVADAIGHDSPMTHRETPPLRSAASTPVSVPPGVEVVLLDVGNCLASDYWETVLLTPDVGLADRLGVDPAAACEAGRTLWERHCRRVSEEVTYWQELESALGVEIPDGVPEELDPLVLANPQAELLLSTMAEAGLRLGVCSNNTAFWFPKQAAKVGLHRYTDAALQFLSHLTGRTKGDDPSLLDLVADDLDPATVLLVDDRPGNLDAAEQRGFHTVRYAMDEVPAWRDRFDGSTGQ